jgi:methionyl-tRNA synthetase
MDENMDQVWKVRFGGDESAKKEEEVPTSKRKAKKTGAINAAPNAVAVSGPKSPEVIAGDAKILEHGQVVRGLKEKKKSKDIVDAAVTELNRIKTELVLRKRAAFSQKQGMTLAAIAVRPFMQTQGGSTGVNYCRDPDE